MNRMLVALILAIAATLAACASTPIVYTDQDPAAQFGGYRTYSWREKAEKAPPLVAQRIVDAVDTQLRAKGWTPVASGGDVVLAAHVATRQEYDLDTFYDDPFWGGWGWGAGWGHWGPGWGMNAGMHTTRVHSYTVGTLVLDMFDANTKQAIWRGTAEAVVPRDPKKYTEQIQTGVTKMFAGFPPGSAPTR
ncbi:DUF4136 domain-containing protein [Lysobacter tyrosinilyticus]